MTRTDHWDGRNPADRLENDLDRMVRGGLPESGAERSGFGPTIEHLYQLASDARITIHRPARKRSASPKTTLFPTALTIPRRTIMSGISMAAVLALMLTIVLNAFPLTSSSDSSQTHLAAVTQGSPSAAEADACAFPLGNQFGTDNPVVPERPPGLVPQSIVIKGANVQIVADIEVLQLVGGRMEHPSEPLRVGWYEQTAAPGDPDNAVMMGFVDHPNVGPAILAQLGTVAAGDEIHVNTASGTTFVYVVEWTRNYDLDSVTDADIAEVLGPTTLPALTIITCGGEFDYESGRYLGRTVVRATSRTSSVLASPVATPAGSLASAPPRPFMREDCNVEPRSREDLIEILGTLPTIEGGNPSALDGTLDQATFDEFQETLRAYQACRLFGMTLQWTALLSENTLRGLVYTRGQTSPYSPAVLDEIVRGWEEVDALRSTSAESLTAEGLANMCAIVLDPDQSTEAGFMVIGTLIQVPAVLTVGEHTEVNTGIEVHTVGFVLEDGSWQIGHIPETRNCA